ncbi:tyrosine-protein phosphatase [Lysinibacter sp. HNR]|uniref:tyrosine-protein phosphatase n=1 Tax=Lysinibacter sp. HNR TaxID=3031408 RepID=UPI002435C24C|nr:tyrosine-protein phosphatase [Lysinibacter sp. HNR]WGD36899.1 tyrosine-protein phosphatase [Lysinibacter sp. HNR]
MTQDLDRAIDVDGLYNMRDSGGLRAGDARIRSRKLLRSDGLHHLTDTGLKTLSQLGIKTIFDLRDNKERAAAPNKIQGLSVATVPSPIFQGSEEVLTGPNMRIEDFYRDMVDNYAVSYASTLTAIADTGDDTVLVHCTAGKDRTGTLIAFALTVAGVDRDDIVHDYSLTEKNLEGEWLDRHVRLVESFGIPVTPNLLKILGGSPPEAMESTLLHVEKRFGSVESYLRSAGMSDADLERLVSVLVG